MERTNTHESLYASSLIEASLDPLVTISKEGKIMDLNQATVNITATNRDKLIGSDFFDYFTEQHKARKVYQEIFAKGFVRDSPLTLCNKDGKLTDVLFNGSVYKDKKGNVLGVVIVARDVTERNRIEEEIKNLNETLEQKVNERTIQLKDVNNKLIIQNKEKEKHANELIIANRELDFQNKEKEKRAVELIVFKEKEKQSAELIFVKDTLIASETRYRRLFETAKDGIIILDADTGMIMDVNPFLIEELGYSKEQFLEKEIWEIGFLKDIISNKEKFLELQQMEYVRYEDLPLKTADGKQLNVEFVSNVYLVNNQKVIQCNIRDITERKKAERILNDIIEKNPMSIQIVDKEGYTIKTNSAHTTLFGAVPPSCFSIFTDLTQKGLGDFILIAKSGDVVHFPDMCYDVHDIFSELPSNPVWIRAILFPLKDSFGKIEQFVFIHENITERKLAEKQIRDLAKFPEENINPVYRVSKDGVLLYSNLASRKLLPAYFPEIGCKIPEQSIKKIQDIYNSGHSQTEEIGFNYRNFSFEQVPIIESEYINLYGIDITERKQAEDLLHINYSIQSTLNSILRLSIEDIPLLELLKQTFDLIINVPSLNIESKGSIFLVDKKKDTLKMVVEKNLSEPIKKACKSVPFGYCLCGKAASTQEMQFADSLNEEHQITYEGIHNHGHYCTPIVYGGKTLGVINVYLKPEHLKNQTEVDFLKAIANTLAGIIVRKNNEMELKTTLDNLELTVVKRTEEINKKNYELREEIEERISIENELSESEEKYRNLIEEAADAIFQGDCKGNFIRINNVSSLLTGYSKNELLKMNMQDLIPEISKSKYLRINMLEQGEIVNEENILTRKDKSGIPIEIKTKKMPDGTYQSIIRDISERKRFENELKKMAVVVEQNPVGIVITKPDGAIEYVNNQYLNISGFIREELIGVKCSLLKSGVHDDNFYKELWNTIILGKIWKGIICNKNKSGELYWEQNTIAPVFDDNGTISNFIGMKEDVSKLKRTEEELIKSKESAEDANRMKSEFLANMSHEIRTPLNAIVGFSSILKEKTSGQKIFTEYLDNIIQSSKVLLALISDILDLSKVESGRMVIEYQPLNLNSLIFELQSVFLMKAKEKGISINIQISKDIPGSIITDEKFLRQILFNLIGNAVKFTNKGSVDIFVNIIPKETEASKVDLIFIVKDTGIGIPSDQLSFIFDPFIQVAQKNRSKYGGTGLGLSITKRLIELMGGLISVESKIGQGSVFSISLFNLEISSLSDDDFKNDNNQKLMNIKFKNPIILMAEDILSNRQVIKGYLEPLNITIIETENGEDCIRVVRKNKPDLILMDMQMPVMDGFTAINILKSDNELKDIPVIALSASGIKQHRDQFEKVADDYLIKPIFKNDLLEMLIKYLPYEELSAVEAQPEEISTTQMYHNVDNKLPDEIKKEIDQTFLKDIVELEEVLNIEELLTFIKELEKINEKYQISKIKEYCDLLTQYAESFNIIQINACLKLLFKFINK